MNGRDGQRGWLQRQRFNPLRHVWRHPTWDATARPEGATEGDQAARPVALHPAPGGPERHPMVARDLRQWDSTFHKRLDNLKSYHGLLACRLGQRRQRWELGLGTAMRRVWTQGVDLRMQHHGSTGVGKKTGEYRAPILDNVSADVSHPSP